MAEPKADLELTSELEEGEASSSCSDDDGAFNLVLEFNDDGEGVVDADDAVAVHVPTKTPLRVNRGSRGHLWSNVVQDQDLSRSLAAVNKAEQRPPVTKGGPEDSRVELPARLMNYRDYDSFVDGEAPREKDRAKVVAKAASSSGSVRNKQVDFGRMVKAVEIGQKKQSALERIAEKQRPAPPRKVSNRAQRGKMKFQVAGAGESGQQRAPKRKLNVPLTISTTATTSTDIPTVRPEIDTSITVDASMDSKQMIDAICKSLGESNSDLMSRCYQILGAQRCHLFYQRTCSKEAEGGLFTMGLARRRKTPGGVFLYLIKTASDVTAQERSSIFQEEKKQQKAAAKMARLA